MRVKITRDFKEGQVSYAGEDKQHAMKYIKGVIYDVPDPVARRWFTLMFAVEHDASIVGVSPPDGHKTIQPDNVVAPVSNLNK